MVELPHFFGLDFSVASSWLVAGFFAGVVLTWLWRALRGRRAKAVAAAQIAEIQGILETSRAEHQSEVARMSSDARSYEIALADAERRAGQSRGEATSLRAEAGRLAQLELSSRNELLEVDKQLAKLRTDLQWAQSQTGNATQEQASLVQRVRAAAEDLATARTAAELKDAEIARLINELQGVQSKTATLEQEKVSSGLDAARLGKSKEAEIARLQDELGSARTHIDRLQDDVAGHAQALTSSQSSYDATWKDLTYTRNLASWQASEVDRLRNLITMFESDVAAKTQELGALQKQYAGLKARLGPRRKGLGGAKSRLAYFRRQGTNGTSADVHAHAKGNGKLAFAHPVRDASIKTRRGKAYKLGKAYSAGGRGAKKAGVTQIHVPSRTRVGAGEIADLKAKLAELAQEAEKYGRRRDAVHVANRIADDSV